MNATQPIPPPGLAILPQYLSANPQKILVKGSFFGSAITATTADGQPLFRIESESFSLSHRQTFWDDATNKKLFQVRKDSSSRYYAELSEDGPRLFETKTHTRFLHRDETTVTFANQADEKRPVVTVEVMPPGTTSGGTFTWNGQVVASVEKEPMSARGRWEFSIVPGFDPVLVIAVMVALIDRDESRSSSSAAAAAGSAGGGGAC